VYNNDRKQSSKLRATPFKRDRTNLQRLDNLHLARQAQCVHNLRVDEPKEEWDCVISNVERHVDSNLRWANIVGNASLGDSSATPRKSGR
jgi:hypothetical protein